MKLVGLIVALLLLAAGLAVGGVYLLVGEAWAMLTAAAALVAFAALLCRSLTANG